MANIGGYVVDGSQDFLASGEGTMAALSYAACGCYRISHKIEVEIEGFHEEIMGKQRRVVRKEEPPRSSTNPSFTARCVRYGECQKNHMANVEGYAIDGCQEFFASGEEGMIAALTCATYGCHRISHKREVETEVVCECFLAPSNEF